jgi:hypothetical protein
MQLNRISLVPILFAAFAFSGCGSTYSTSSDSIAEATASTIAVSISDTDFTPVVGNAAGATAFRDCLNNNGVELPEGGLGLGAGGVRPSLPEGIDQAALQKAVAACQSEMPAGMALPGGANGPDLTAFFTCLRDNGVDVKENATPADIPVSDPKFAAASETCRPLLPEGLRPGVAAGRTGAGSASTTIAP